MHDALYTFDLAPTQADDALTDRLEEGQVVFCPALPFIILAAEQSLLNPDLLDGRHKNISMHPKRPSKIGGAKRDLAVGQQAALQQLMQRFHTQVMEWVSLFFPTYYPHLEIGRVSFRPAEIEGRQQSKRHDDTRLHVDAFPSTPLQGKRILRVFSNIDPHGKPRVWHVGEPFAQVWERFGADIPTYRPRLMQLLHHLRLTKSKRSLYDHCMLHLHDGMKLDDHYQQTVQKTRVEFPAGSSWFVFTDVVSHAALKGQFVLEQTFYLPQDKMKDPQRAPLSKN